MLYARHINAASVATFFYDELAYVLTFSFDEKIPPYEISFYIASAYDSASRLDKKIKLHNSKLK